jgi:hypothetical protein
MSSNIFLLSLFFHHEGSDTTDGINKVKTKQNNLVDFRKGVYHLKERNNVKNKL